MSDADQRWNPDYRDKPVGCLTIGFVTILLCAFLMVLGWSYGLSSIEVLEIGLLAPVFHILLHVMDKKSSAKKKNVPPCNTDRPE